MNPRAAPPSCSGRARRAWSRRARPRGATSTRARGTPTTPTPSPTRGKGFREHHAQLHGFFSTRASFSPTLAASAEGRVMLDAGRAVATLLEGTPPLPSTAFSSAGFSPREATPPSPPPTWLRPTRRTFPWRASSVSARPRGLTTSSANLPLLRRGSSTATTPFLATAIDLAQVLAEPWLDSFVGGRRTLVRAGGAGRIIPRAPKTSLPPPLPRR